MLPRRSFLLGSAAWAQPATYHLALFRGEPPPEAAAPTLSPLNWKAFYLDRPTILGFKALIRRAEPSRFRLALAFPSNEESRVEVYLPRLNFEPAVMDLRYPDAFDIFEVELDPEATQAALEGGIGLRRTAGMNPLAFLAPEPSGSSTPSELQPHLLVAGTEPRRRELEDRLLGGACLRPWGWKLGCALDGLLDSEKSLGRRARRSFDRWMNILLPGAAALFESSGNPAQGRRVQPDEGLLPLGALARRDSKHGSLGLASVWWRQAAGPRQRLVDPSGKLQSRDCYTIAYPLAVLSSVLGDAALADYAANLLRVRRQVLASQDAIFGQAAGGELRFKNWSRGIAWYMLGHARSLPYFRESQEAADALREAAALALRTQRADGLWTCFAGDDKTGVETSGSAGVAAALALGVKAKMLDSAALAAARRTAAALETYLTPDGLLSGVSADERAGESLQRGSYRCHAPFAMGLYAQLLGAIA